jgi:adenine-specific DNA-methyltransferase
MEGLVDTPLDTERPWQADLCQFFTRKKVAELCLRHVTFPKNILSVRLLEPAAGQGAFFLPLLERLVRSCLRQKKNFDVLRPIIRAYEIDAQVAITLRLQTETTLEALGIDGPTARHIARDWIRNEDFLEARPRTRFTHIVGNPPYIRWEAIPGALRESYKARFTSFKQRADLYVAFIEHALSLLDQRGQLGFYAPERGRVTFTATPCAKRLRLLASLRPLSISAMRKASRRRPTPILISLYFRRARTARPEYVPWRGAIRSGRRGRP